MSSPAFHLETAFTFQSIFGGFLTICGIYTRVHATYTIYSINDQNHLGWICVKEDSSDMLNMFLCEYAHTYAWSRKPKLKEKDENHCGDTCYCGFRFSQASQRKESHAVLILLCSVYLNKFSDSHLSRTLHACQSPYQPPSLSGN